MERILNCIIGKHILYILWSCQIEINDLLETAMQTNWLLSKQQWSPTHALFLCWTHTITQTGENHHHCKWILHFLKLITNLLQLRFNRLSSCSVENMCWKILYHCYIAADFLYFWENAEFDHYFHVIIIRVLFVRSHNQV